jgi:hypothetical protein
MIYLIQLIVAFVFFLIADVIWAPEWPSSTVPLICLGCAVSSIALLFFGGIR